MDNIIEKLGITKAPYYNSHDYSNVSRYVQNISDKLYPYIRDVEEQRNQMLKVLIKSVLLEEKIIRDVYPEINVREAIEHERLYIKEKNGQEALQDLVDKIEVIEKATGKSWEEIKELLGEIN